MSVALADEPGVEVIPVKIDISEATDRSGLSGVAPVRSISNLYRPAVEARFSSSLPATCPLLQ